jgi:multiple sugar transport system ATP-binding protein
MNGGLLQQYDAPEQVFAHPVNVFVASFIGSPAMSLIPLEVVNSGGSVQLHSSSGWIIELSPANSRKALSARTGKVILGARHSTLALSKSAVPGSVPGRIYTVEPTGDITFAQVDLGGSIVIVSVAPSIALAPDEPVWITFDQERMHLFDGETQLALVAQ